MGDSDPFSAIGIDGMLRPVAEQIVALRLEEAQDLAVCHLWWVLKEKRQARLPGGSEDRGGGRPGLPVLWEREAPFPGY